jgi:hypothetical protein
MYCDRSAYYQKAIKATARRLKINSSLLWLFLLFGRLVFQYNRLKFFMEYQPIVILAGVY